jgi:Fe-S oxidoreductase
MLWVDTFTNHLSPAIAVAALDVLERFGFDVELSPRGLCCGRPLYDYGFLETAKTQLERIMTSLESALSAGTPILGLEPSCVSVFRDELTNLFPDDPRAQALKRQTQLVTEFLSNQPHLPWPSISGRAIVHMHCHHKAVLDSAADPITLQRIGLETNVLDSGCCGMAGSFGFERDHYDVSIAIGERILLPAVRAARQDDFIVADGFSCREQIVQTTGRQALHPIELVAQAMSINRTRAGSSCENASVGPRSIS